VRFLICPGGGYGNLHPLVPLAMALADRGHAVAFATPPIHLGTVRELGFEGFPTGPSGGVTGIVTRETAAELADLGEAERARMVIDAFAALAEATVPDLSAVIRRWRPDVLVRDTTAFSAWIAAETAGIPVALFDFAGVPPPLAARIAGPRLNRLRAAFGLAADPTLASVYRWLVLLGAPPGWSDLDQLAPTAHLLQPPEFDRAPIESQPDWLDSLKGRSRLVYATLGTVFGDSPDIWAAIFAAVAAEPELSLIATVGPAANPRRFGALPANIRVEPYLPQSWLLDTADAVIGHGGYGTIMGALRRGLPILTIPMQAADNHMNGARVAALGAGLMLGQDQRNAAAIRQALQRVLNEPGFRHAARDLAAATAALPSEQFGACLLERLARDRRPILRETTSPPA
jgi:UDP:flavonoid glycosyltransferase YjiC (YdhE family)